MGCASIKKASKEIVLNSFDVCGITTDDSEKILYLKNALNDYTVEEIASDSELIDNDYENCCIRNMNLKIQAVFVLVILYCYKFFFIGILNTNQWMCSYRTSNKSAHVAGRAALVVHCMLCNFIYAAK